MSGVGFFGTIIIGLLAGWLAERFTKADHGLLKNLVLGVLGAVVAGWLAGRLGIFLHGWIDNLIGGTLGAVALILIYRQLKSS